MKYGDVNVVIPMYNREGLIGRCLDSVYAQSISPTHVYVVDNNSSDGSIAAVENWLDQHPGYPLTILHESKRGASAARNRGLKEVASKYVIFFDSDDCMAPTLIEEALTNIGNAQLIYWKAEITNIDGNKWIRPFHAPSRRSSKRQRSRMLLYRQVYNSMLATQVYMAESNFIRGIGGWNEDALVWNDWELGIRIALAEPDFVALPSTLSYIYAQEVSITGKAYSDKPGLWERTLAIVDKFGREHLGRLTKERSWNRMIAYRLVNLAAQYRKEGAKEPAAATLAKAKAMPGVGKLRQLLASLICRYTAAGGRGGYYFWMN